MRDPFRDKFAFELLIEETWKAVQFRITRLVTGTWLEFFVLDPVGQYAAVTAIALILSLCVGRFHTIVDTWKIVVDKALARPKGKNAKPSGDGTRDGDDPGTARNEGAAGYEDGPNDVRNKQEAAMLATRLQNVHISTPKRTSPLAPRAQPQRNHSVLVERDANTVNLLKYQTPLRKAAHMTTGDPETIRKRKEQLDRLRMWS
ncbi:hypothetical protein P171DRAFT_486246 [Karstenula rhodostoma CBS 690.94]|uniref:Uncharacterized protein n=1 Tax=Karstenula rhodostoma CBS 690.94 TaxID=1392251 RepID=A0A9P4PEE1_9PLEO|nr:hypothetical protein P171DRAFT_486246 [Karstenula rhodostoma CBS 690.94]